MSALGVQQLKSAEVGRSALDRVQAIWDSPAYQEHLARIERAEEQRVYCRHGVCHALDVARIAWILNLERACGLDRELIYAAALLHDIGRSAQYGAGEPHDEAGERIAAAILDGFDERLRFRAVECDAILAAVRGHRGAPTSGSEHSEGDSQALVALICEADNRSRPCYACAAREDCYWPDERKNLSVDI